MDRKRGHKNKGACSKERVRSSTREVWSRLMCGALKTDTP